MPILEDIPDTKEQPSKGMILEDIPDTTNKFFSQDPQKMFDIAKKADELVVKYNTTSDPATMAATAIANKEPTKQDLLQGTIRAIEPKSKRWFMPSDDEVRASGYDNKARYIFDQYVARPAFGYTVGTALGAFEPVWKLFQTYKGDDMPEQWRGKTLEQAVGTASTEETPFFADMAHGLAEFVGSYKSAEKILPAGEGLLTDKPKMLLEAERFFTATALPEAAKVISQEEGAGEAIRNVVDNTVGGAFFGGTEQLAIGEAKKLFAQSLFMYGQARVNGEDREHAAIQGALPFIFKASERLKNTIPPEKVKAEVKTEAPVWGADNKIVTLDEYNAIKTRRTQSAAIEAKKPSGEAVGAKSSEKPATAGATTGTEAGAGEPALSEAKQLGLVKRFLKEEAGSQDPEAIADMLKVGAFHFEAGAREFLDWSAKMVSDFGESIKPQLQTVWQKLQQEEEKRIVSPPVKDTIISQEADSKVDNPANVHDAVRNVLGGNAVSKIGDIWQQFSGYIGGLAGETMPHTTRANRETGEAGARYISARIEAPFRAKDITGEILETGTDPMKIGAVLTEDNLRSIRDGYEKAGDTDAAENVKSIVGDSGYFKTEEEYQAALNDPLVKETLERFKQIFSPIMDDLYKTSQDIAPDETLPTRGYQTGVRINLKAVTKDQPVKKGDAASGQSSGGNLLGSFKKKSPFGVKAKGTGQDYDINLYNIIENTYARQLEIARYKEYIQSLIDNDLAVEGTPGQAREGYTAFPLQRKTVVVDKDGTVKAYPKSQTLYVKNEYAGEFRGAINVDAPVRGRAIRVVNRALNSAAIAGLTDATAHTLNLTTAMLTRPGIGGGALREGIAATGGFGDIAVVAYNMIKKGIDAARNDPETIKQMADLARIGALRPAGGHGGKITGVGGRFLRYYDRLSRLVMDDGYQFLVNKGLAEDSETARREFVNQVGQYNRRAQGEIMRTLKDAGVSPFIVAGKTFTTLGVRNVTMNPGVPATTPVNSAAMKGLVAARWAGTIGTVMLANYMLTKDKGGGIMGRPGTPILSIDTGKDTDDGRPITFPLGSIFGYTRGLRVTGLRGTIEGLRNGLTPKQSVQDGLQDIENSLISTIAGPPVRFAVGALTGFPVAVGFPRQYPVVPPGEIQKLSDLKYAVGYSNPLSAAWIEGARKSPGDWTAQFKNFVQRQLPGITPKEGMKPETVANLPKIVNAGQVNAFVDWTAKEARKLPMEKRAEYIMQQIEKIDDPMLRADYTNKVFRKGVFYP